MAHYRTRIMDAAIERALHTFGAVILEGARAVGKTTTALRHSASSVRLDSSPDLLTLAETAPETVLRGDTPRLVDEWQLAPTVWNAVRHAVDVRGLPGQFILTGSQTPADDVTRHSGAGRFRRLRLRPMTLSESGESLACVALGSLFDGGEISLLDALRPIDPSSLRMAFAECLAMKPRVHSGRGNRAMSQLGG